MDVLTVGAAFGLGVVLFLVLLGLEAIVERSSTLESRGRAVSGAARSTVESA